MADQSHAAESREPWSVRDLDILAANIEIARDLGRSAIRSGEDPLAVLDRMLDHIAGFVAGREAMIVPPHMIDPADLAEAVALGRKLAARYKRWGRMARGLAGFGGYRRRMYLYALICDLPYPLWRRSATLRRFAGKPR